MTDGGPAFPLPGDQFEEGTRVARSFDAPGMSLRDYFAAHAPTGDPIVLGSWQDAEHQREIYAACAENTYLWADAMIRAREKGAPA